MSKRSEEFANKAYPNYSPDGKTQVDMTAYRFACAKGYKQAEKDIKERLLELIEEEEKFWDDGEMIFRGLKNKLNEL